MHQIMEGSEVQTGPYLVLEVDVRQLDQQERYGHSGQQYRQQHIRDQVRQLRL
jgi:hypothetical protein